VDGEDAARPKCRTTDRNADWFANLTQSGCSVVKERVCIKVERSEY